MNLLPLLFGCTSPTFTQEWLVDRTRVLALRAEPPEAPPGTLVQLSALVVDPAGEPLVAWVQCPLPVDCPDYGSVQELAGADTSTMSDEERAEWQASATSVGLLGFGTALTPTLFVSAGVGAPDTGLPDTAEPDTAEPDTAEPDTGGGDTGTPAGDSEITLVLDAIPAGKGLDDVTLGDAEATEVATKTFTVSTSPTPNQNPVVESFTVDGATTAVVRTGGQATLEASLSAASSETYTDADGDAQTEAPTLAYYASGGTLGQSAATAESPEVTWTAPDSSGTVDVWVVARDGRGGMTWASVTVTVE